MSDDTQPKVTQQLSNVWSKLPRSRRLALVAAGFGTLLLVGYMALGGSDKSYEILFSGMTAEDAGEIASALESRGVDYRVAGGGAIIEVEAGKVHETRIALASSGLPRGGGVGFEIFDDQSLGTTSFVEQVNYRRAMQGELSRTISALTGVEAARVHLAMGRRSVFREADEKPTASITVRLRRGATLAREQVRGIVHLVSSSVDGMEPSAVVVVDDRGTVLSAGEDDASMAAQTDLEETLSERVRQMIARVVGPDHVEVVVTATMDRRKVEQTEEIYDKDNTALRSEARTVEGQGAQEAVGGIAGAQGNLPGAPGGGGGGKGTSRLSETRNFEINKTVRRVQTPSAQLARLHVAVLVDHKPEGPAEEGAEPKMVPRTKDELAQIAAIARNAAGIDDARGDSIEIRSVAFNQAPLPEPLPEVAATSALPAPPATLAAIGGGALFVMVFAIVWTLRRRKKKQKSQVVRRLNAELVSYPASLEAVERALDAEDPIAALAASNPTSLPGEDINARIADAVRKDPRRAADVLKGWLAEARQGAA